MCLSASQQVVTQNVSTARAMKSSGESDTSIANVIVVLPTNNPDVHSWFQQVKTIFLMLTIKSQWIKVANLMQKLPPDGWLGLRHANPSGYFMPKTFLFIIWYNFYAYSYLNAINKFQRHQNKTICGLELSAEVSI